MKAEATEKMLMELARTCIARTTPAPKPVADLVADPVADSDTLARVLKM